MKFIILCYPRTGSTLLITALGDHPDIRQGMEIFNPILEGNAYYVDWRKQVLLELYGKQDSYTDAIGYLDADSGTARPLSISAALCKTALCCPSA
jgi:hypothetical protein